MLPTDAEYVSAGHALHDVLPDDEAYVPTPHIVQEVAPGEYEFVDQPAGHNVQLELLLVTEYLPVGQAAHSKPP